MPAERESHAAALSCEEAAEEALTLADFDADVGKGAAADLSDCTFYASTDELLAGLSAQAESSET